MLDTGSVVSSLLQSFYEEHLSDLELKPLKEILNVEHADGEKLPYLGYIVADTDAGNSLERSNSHTCLFLLVPETKYSAQTPIIVGKIILTELLTEVKDTFGVQFLYKAKLQTPLVHKFQGNGSSRKGTEEER